jgi:sialidase-1
MRKLIIVFLYILIWKVGLTQKEVTVFESGKEGYASFRIPSVVKLPNHKILAFAEGRVNGGADFGNIKIVLKSSDDQGKTWSTIKVVASYGQWQVGNAAPVVDVLDPAYPNGKIYLFYNTGNVSEMELRQGKGLREVWYISSVDEGTSWSGPVNITSQVHFPNGEMDGRKYSHEKDWRTYANTPGHATQCMDGKYKGRIYIPANHSEGVTKAHFKDYYSHGYYSDDHGKTFHVSKSLNIEGSNEATAAFISNDRLIMNVRNQPGDVKSRIVAYSNDGGESFEAAKYDTSLPDPVCEGAILNIGKRQGKSVLAFVNAADKANRNNLTLKISYDEGLSWPVQHLIDGVADLAMAKKDYTAYSDIIKIGRRKVGVFYEKENYSKMVFKSVKW